MKKITQDRRIGALILVIAVGVASTAIPTVATAAAPPPGVSGDSLPSEWSGVGGGAHSGEAPSLSNDVGQQGNATGSELTLGLGMAGVGLLLFAYGLLTKVRTGRAATPSDGHGIGLATAEHAPHTA